ncbi:hypothetical protein EJ02DRAFT_308860, partial [Clathrospora elynae]
MPRTGILDHDTPKKARVKGAAACMDYKRIPYLHTDLFTFNHISKTRGWAILKEE